MSQQFDKTTTEVTLKIRISIQYNRRCYLPTVEYDKTNEMNKFYFKPMFSFANWKQRTFKLGGQAFNIEDDVILILRYVTHIQ